MSSYKYNWDNYPNSRKYREKINNYLNYLLDIETDSNDQAIYIPDLEINETNEAFYLKFEIPGMTKRQIDLEITSNVVTIRGERTFRKDAENES